jgi:hypothetical protein
MEKEPHGFVSKLMVKRHGLLLGEMLCYTVIVLEVIAQSRNCREASPSL